MAEKRVEAVDVIKLFISLILVALPRLMVAQELVKPTKKALPTIDLIYSYYMQDGNNSAVTGGTGTEELSYNSPTIVVHIPTDSVSSLSVKAGIDIYSSASQDNIDFNVSSASAQDARTHFTLGYDSKVLKKEVGYGFRSSFSIESDYTSLGLGGYYSKGWHNYNTVLTLDGQVYFDDCRWGRLNRDYVNELQLIYPVELRGIDWESKYMRYTSTLSLSLTQLLTKRLNIGFYADAVWQSGLLSTTFHRIYFSDQLDHSIEKLPYQRLKIPMALRINYFVAKRFLLRSYYRFYADSWGISGNTIELEPTFKVGTFFSVFPFYRFYSQSAAHWFRPYATHSINQEFFTSDYDLSHFNAHKLGVGILWNPLGGVFHVQAKKNLFGWQSIQFRTGYYKRSDGLESFFFSTALRFGPTF